MRCLTTKKCVYNIPVRKTPGGKHDQADMIKKQPARQKIIGGLIMNVKPLFDKVVVENVTVEEKTKSGFFLPSSAQEKPQTCVVVAVGPGGLIDGNEVKMQVKPGDKVLCAKYAGTDFKVDGKEFTIIKQSDILAIVED